VLTGTGQRVLPPALRRQGFRSRAGALDVGPNPVAVRSLLICNVIAVLVFQCIPAAASSSTVAPHMNQVPVPQGVGEVCVSLPLSHEHLALVTNCLWL
jgi:hypothetical protein